MQTLDAKQAAALLHCDYKTVISKAASGQIPAMKMGRAWLFPSDELEEFIRAEVKKQTEARKPPSVVAPVAAPPVKRRGRPRTTFSP